MTKESFPGLFWEEIPKLAKPEPKPVPRTWEEPGYLPKLAALPYAAALFNRFELSQAQAKGERLVVDCELYPNYFLVSFMSIQTGKAISFEWSEQSPHIDLPFIRWIMENFLTVGFNSNYFDNTILQLLLAGHSIADLCKASYSLIQENVQPWLVLRGFKLRSPKWNHIDLIEVAPLQASLKIYAGRLHSPRIQDLPFKFNTLLTPAQIEIVKNYNVGSDLVGTCFLYTELKPHIELREKMSFQYGVDLRSKSDAQVAETVIEYEYLRLSYCKAERPQIPPGTKYRYQIPEFISFKTPLLNQMLDTIAATQFVVSETGGIEKPAEFESLQFNIAEKIYKMGIGGLHSQEESIAHFADNENLLIDRDVASYYPAVLLHLGLFPKHLGPDFLSVYKTLVDRRKEAKNKSNDKSLSDVERKQWKIIADALKISINGIFGKTGNKYSIVYAPDMLIQITITGQLSLLMLIERSELAGIPVASANTDGIVFKCPKNRKDELNRLVADWEKETGFETEETEYKAIYARDVNNYIAVKIDDKTKTKGKYSEVGSALNSVLSKNPECLICSDAVQSFLSKGTLIKKTINDCKDIRRFVTLRTVKGGACKDGIYLGKAIRWYYAKDETGEIVYASNGYKVPKSEGAKPLMDLPEQLPEDLDFSYYEKEAYLILKEIGWKEKVL